jgi:hypothetical protein
VFAMRPTRRLALVILVLSALLAALTILVTLWPFSVDHASPLQLAIGSLGLFLGFMTMVLMIGGWIFYARVVVNAVRRPAVEIGYTARSKRLWLVALLASLPVGLLVELVPVGVAVGYYAAVAVREDAPADSGGARPTSAS